MRRFSRVRNESGVYLLLDLDERPLYVGKSGKLRNRLIQHFVRQDSSVTADGILDLYDVLRVQVWYGDAADLDAMESLLYQQVGPRWNRSIPLALRGIGRLPLGEPDCTINLIDSPEQLALRREPLVRVESKLIHLLAGVRKARVSGMSAGVREALAQHTEELARMVGDLERPM